MPAKKVVSEKLFASAWIIDSLIDSFIHLYTTFLSHPMLNSSCDDIEGHCMVNSALYQICIDGWSNHIGVCMNSHIAVLWSCSCRKLISMSLPLVLAQPWCLGYCCAPLINFCVICEYCTWYVMRIRLAGVFSVLGGLMVGCTNLYFSVNIGST